MATDRRLFGAACLYNLGLLAQQQGGAWQYPLADGLGSIRYLTNPQAQVLTSYRFDPFGVPLSQDGGGQPFGYAGEAARPMRRRKAVCRRRPSLPAGAVV